jgi:hypothetical protein
LLNKKNLKKGLPVIAGSDNDNRSIQEGEFNRLANMIRDAVDMKLIYDIALSTNS